MWYNNLMWYTDPEVLEFLKNLKLTEIEPRLWADNERRTEIYDSGISIVICTRVLPDTPQCDVTTVHDSMERDAEFFADAIEDHTNEIVRRTKEIEKNGIAAIADRSSLRN